MKAKLKNNFVGTRTEPVLKGLDMLFKDMISCVWGREKPLKQGKCEIFALFNPEGSNTAAKRLV